MNDSSTSVEPTGYCPHCSRAGSYTLHAGRCPEVAAKEYHPNGSLKRIEFVGARIAGLHQGSAEMTLDFNAPMKLVDSTKWAREVMIKEPLLLEPGKYTIVLGELRRVVDDIPPDLSVAD